MTLHTVSKKPNQQNMIVLFCTPVTSAKRSKCLRKLYCISFNLLNMVNQHNFDKIYGFVGNF